MMGCSTRIRSVEILGCATGSVVKVTADKESMQNKIQTRSI
jgi:hypothetical protein